MVATFDSRRLRPPAMLIAGVLACSPIGPPRGAAASPVPAPIEAAVVQKTDVDFNGDGFADLAMGDMFALGDDGYEGAVHVMYGSTPGLSADRSTYLTEDDLGGEGHRWDIFGGSLATGDFDGDRRTDLAIGIMLGELDAPYGDEGSDHGLVRIVYGSDRGLGAQRSQLWSYGRMTGGPDLGHHFGSELAAGNFGRGLQDDLAISAGSETVAVMYGSPTGITGSGFQLWSQNSPGIAGTTSTDQFGASMVAGHFAGRPYADLAIGAPGEKVGSKTGAGAVNVIYGSAAGLSAAGNQLWTQNSAGIKGKAERDDAFGARLAAGRLNGTAFDALAVGVPCESIGSRRCAGAVNVVYGSASGLRSAGDQFWSQSSRGVPGKSEASEEFGGTLAIGNFGRDIGGRPYADLAIGTASEAVGGVAMAGAATVIYGSPTGLRSRHSRTLTQKTSGIPGTVEYQDMFASSMAAADVDHSTKSPFDELIVTVGGETTGRNFDPASMITVIQGASAGLNTRRCQTWSARKLGHGSADGDATSFGDPVVG